MAGGKIYTDEVAVNATGKATVGDISTLEVTFSIATADVAALNSAPQTVVAAAPADYYNEFVSATLWYDYATAAFGGIASGEDLQFRVGTVPVSATCEATGFLDQATDQVRHVNAYTAAQYVPAAATAINLFLTTGDITAGGTCRLRGKVYYRQRPLTW
jgi:hypothetical protein